MTTLVNSFAFWLADYYLLATLLSSAALAACVGVKQPVQRLTIARSTIAALALLAALCALPGWSLVHVLTTNNARIDVPQVTTSTDDTAPPAGEQLLTTGIVTPTLADGETSAAAPPLPAARSSSFWSDISWSKVVVTSYVAGAACVVTWLVLGSVAAHRLCRSATPAPSQLVALMNEAAAQGGKPTRAELRVSESIDVAVALGMFRPVVLLPTSWLESLSTEALRAVLAHETAHIRNGDLCWLVAGRMMLILLWAQPLYWLLRRRVRTDQELLADAAAAEVTSRQRYAEQLVGWARHMPARPAPHLSAAVGLWERPSQLRERVALLVNEHYTVLRDCSRSWRLATVGICTLSALAFSLVTLHPAQSQRQSIEQESPVETSNDNGIVADKSERIVIDDKFVLCRVTTDLQRSLLGNVARPDAYVSLCVFVNFATFTDDQIAADSPAFVALSNRLLELANHDNRYVTFRILVAPDQHASFQARQKRAENLAKSCADRARAAGFERATWSTTYFGIESDWSTSIEKADAAAKLAESSVEDAVGDGEIQVFPVRTYLSRLLVTADCVVNVTPVVRQKEGTRFPDDFLPAMKRFIPQLEYETKQTLLVRLKYAESARERLDKWVEDVAGRDVFAKQFGFGSCQLEQSFTDWPESPQRSDATSAAANTLPIDIPIIVAQHVMLSEGKIIEWADVERMISALPNPKLAHPNFRFTHGALPKREEEIRAKIWDLRKRVELAGHSWGSLLPRASARYDAIRTAADLVPNGAHRVQGTVVTGDGRPVDGAEVVLLPPAPESVPYKTLDVYLRNEQLRTPEDEIVTRSDAAGQFAVYPQPGTPYHLVALHREGFGMVRSDEFGESGRIDIKPWARVIGHAHSDARVKQSATVTVQLPAADGWPEVVFHQYSVDLGPPPPDGSFELAFVPASLTGTLSRHVEGAEGTSYSLPVQEFQLASDETLAADIGLPSEADTQQIEDLKSRLQQQREESAKPDGAN